MADVCIDCGQPMPLFFDLALCDPCLRVAARLVGSGQARVDILTGGAR